MPFIKVLTCLFCCASALLLAACQSAPVHTVSYLQLQTAAERLLQQAIYVQTAQQYLASNPVYSDSPADTATSTAAANLCGQWQAVNWPLVAGADGFYRASLREHRFNYGGEDVAPSAYEFLQAEQSAALKQVRGIIVRFGREAVCAAEVLQGKLETALEENVARELLDYARQHPAAPATGEQVPTLAGSRDLTSNPGRSYFMLENRSRSNDCPQPRMYILQNQWPDEAYIVVCEKQQQLFHCEWGHCEQRQ